MGDEREQLEKVLEGEGSIHILRMLEPLKHSPAGKIIYAQISRMLHDYAHQQHQLIRGYAGLAQTLLAAFSNKLPKNSLLYLELKLVQRRITPPVSLSELIALQRYIKKSTDLINQVTEPDQQLLQRALAPLLGSTDEETPTLEEAPVSNIPRKPEQEELPAKVEIPPSVQQQQKRPQSVEQLQNLHDSLSHRMQNTRQTQEKLSGILAEMLQRMRQLPENKEPSQRQWFVDRLNYLQQHQDELLTALNDTNSFLNLMGHSSRQLHEELDQARVLSLTDDLTRLPNRRAFLRRLEDEIGRSEREGTPLTLALIDLDDFKTINDRFGHAIGDAILRIYATQILSIFRRYDMVARYGGEEFAVLLPNSPKSDAIKAFTKVQRKAAETYYTHNDVSHKVPTFSAGLAIHRPGETIHSLMERADQMMYRAKQQGKNRIEFDDSYLAEKKSNAS